MSETKPTRALLTDENLVADAVAVARSLGGRVTTVFDVGLDRTDDAIIFSYALEH